MAETEDLFGKIGSDLVTSILGGGVWIIVILILVAFIGGLVYYFVIYRKKFDIRVKIISNRADDDYSVIFDKAAILYEWKTKIPYFRVWYLKRDFPVPKYRVLQKTNKGDYLEIYRDSEERFYYLTPPRITNKYVLNSDGKSIPFADHIQVRIDPEMDFWRLKREGLNKKMFDTESLLMKLLPYIPHIIGGIFMLFILYVFMDKLPAILEQLKLLSQTLNNAQTAQITTG